MYCRTVKLMLLITFGSTTSLENNLKMFTGYRTVRTVYNKRCTLPYLCFFFSRGSCEDSFGFGPPPQNSDSLVARKSVTPQLIPPVLRIRDVYPGSWFLDAGSASKNFSILAQKNGF
jgi:hypothetical protein